MKFDPLAAVAVLAALPSVDTAVVAWEVGFGIAEAGLEVDIPCTVLATGEGSVGVEQLVDSQCIEAAIHQLHSQLAEVQIHSAEAAAVAEVEHHTEMADRTAEAQGARCCRRPGKNWSSRTWLRMKMLNHKRHEKDERPARDRVGLIFPTALEKLEARREVQETTNPVLAYATANT
jgi:hypothetical protein